MADAWQFAQGDSMRLLGDISDASIDAIVTDPPYSSGGSFRSDRNTSTAAKYVSGATAAALPDFHGDTRTERGLLLWCSLWMGECWRVAKPGAAIAVFCDWRSMPTMSDALQSGGWSWRGVAVWTKPRHKCRPIAGGLWNRSEFVLWASKGPRGGDCLEGHWLVGAPGSTERLHQTEKPQEVLTDLVRLAPEGGTVLDPFAGSGSTGVAALNAGRRFVGFELSAEYSALAIHRLQTVTDTGADVRTDQFSLWGAPNQGAN